MAIKNDGTVLESDVLSARSNLKVIFNWVVTLLEAAVMSSPHTSSTKPGPERDKELGGFGPYVHVKYFSEEKVDEDEDGFMDENDPDIIDF